MEALKFDLAVMVAATQYEKDGTVSDSVQDEINQKVQEVHSGYCSKYLDGGGGNAGQPRKFQSVSAFKNFSSGI